MESSVLLIDPTYNPGNIPPNLGLGQIAEQLNRKHINYVLADFVNLHQANLTLNKFEEIEEQFIQSCVELASKVDAVYISGSHGMEMKPYAMFPRISRIANCIKTAHPSIKILFGGALARYYSIVLRMSPAQFQEFGIDSVINEPERRCASHIMLAVGLPFTPSRDDAPSDDYNFPKWDAWDFSKYPDYVSAMLMVGCPFSCSFCFEGKVYENNGSQHSPPSLISAMDVLNAEHGISSVMIEDSICLSLPWFPSMINSFQGQEYSWSIYARSNEIIKHCDRLSMLKPSGCKSIILGIENFEDELHLSTEKRITTAQSLKALELCSQFGVAVQGCMILGFPDDNLDKVQKRITAARDLALSCYRWHILQPDWSNPPENIRGIDGTKPLDHLSVQVSIPDSAIPEYLEKAPPMAIYDEHLLVRALSHYEDIPQLSDYGYGASLNFRDLARLMKQEILKMDKPINEDEMYPILFNPI